MTIAMELGMSMAQFYREVDHEELGWWIAYYQLKHEREEKAAKRRRRGSKRVMSDD